MVLNNILVGCPCLEHALFPFSKNQKPQQDERKVKYALVFSIIVQLVNVYELKYFVKYWKTGKPLRTTACVADALNRYSTYPLIRTCI